MIPEESLIVLSKEEGLAQTDKGTVPSQVVTKERGELAMARVDPSAGWGEDGSCVSTRMGHDILDLIG
ncbi:hypothetical protein GOP47_0030723 [Adiantum capillus-veneris]|nr:hypothetical protein GOP47_0030723 [Adiantum capillus-veneris]